MSLLPELPRCCEHRPPICADDQEEQLNKFLDAYTLRARLAPAVIAAAPAFAFIALLISWSSLSLSNAIATIGLAVLLFALSDFARSRGKRIEPQVFDALGGKPSVTILRHSDATFDGASKQRYLAFLGDKVGETPPSESTEQREPSAADAFYERCGTWLRENTRNAKKFAILFNENVTYGYRRNLFALKWPALALNLTVAASCIAIFLAAPLAPFVDSKSRVFVVLAVAAIHALYIGFGVTRSGLEDAANLSLPRRFAGVLTRVGIAGRFEHRRRRTNASMDQRHVFHRPSDRGSFESPDRSERFRRPRFKGRLV